MHQPGHQAYAAHRRHPDAGQVRAYEEDERRADFGAIKMWAGLNGGADQQALRSDRDR